MGVALPQKLAHQQMCIRDRCQVEKYAGDDTDATNGLPIQARVARTEGNAVTLDGGEGVGRVTLPGLEQPVGAAAINQVPRRMIAESVRAAAKEAGYTGGLAVTICVPGGAEAAAHTFNPRLGIEGGISILGTSGIVEPQSLAAPVSYTHLTGWRSWRPGRWP